MVKENPERKMAIVEIELRDKTKAIGKSGKIIGKTRMLVRRHF